MMQISKRFPDESEKLTRNGFTLVEMLVVLGIMSLAAVLFIGAANRSGASARMDLVKLEREIVSARQLAITSGQAQEVEIASAGYSLRGGLRGEDALLFYPDGSSNGGQIFWGEKAIAKIRWIDGRLVQ